MFHKYLVAPFVHGLLKRLMSVNADGTTLSSGGREVRILADLIVAQVDKSAGTCFIITLSPTH